VLEWVEFWEEGREATVGLCFTKVHGWRGRVAFFNTRPWEVQIKNSGWVVETRPDVRCLVSSRCLTSSLPISLFAHTVLLVGHKVGATVCC